VSNGEVKKGGGIAVGTAYHPRLCAPVVSGPLTPSVSLDGWYWLGLYELNHCAVCLLSPLSNVSAYYLVVILES